jgi:FtsP/CotA-like multicopper oxidase with cupredoxin domain
MVFARDPAEFAAFGCDVVERDIPTPDRQNPNITFERKGANTINIRMPDGNDVQFWNFTDPRDDRSKNMFPSKPIRVRQGQIVHSTLDAQKNQHTIHHHGMNSSTFNDGVGHVSFEVSGKYTYQFQPKWAGTYFYHCHKNTVLHFEYGMYGLLIVDPPEGPGKLYQNGPAYDVEAFWVPDDCDPRWHKMNHDAGMCGDDVGLDRFEPKYFLVSGVPAPRTETDKRVVVNSKVGQRILVRHLNASYSIVQTTIEGLDATIYGVDGRPLGDPKQPWAKPIFLPAGSPLETCSAQRRDLIIQPTRPGRYRVKFEFRDWVGRGIQNNGAGVAYSYINVT